MAPPSKPPTEAQQNTEKNQYIPSFIANAPFYVPADSTDDYLTHQRLQKAHETDPTSKWYDRGAKRGPAATKYRKGACENCGAMTHKKKDCLSRPRKQGAKWTGADIQADEVVMDVKLGWDAKRDRWNGFSKDEYQKVVDEYNELDALRRGGEVEGEGEGDRYEEETDMGRQQSTSTRNLRLREDTAKYLLNLDLDGAQYDPKTRSLAAAEEGTGKGTGDDAKLVAEEGFVRKGGDAAEFEKAQRYAWERQEAGAKIHLQANPTAGELALKKEAGEAEAKKAAHRKALLDKYGGDEHLGVAPGKDLMVTESETFVEYDESGGVKGAPKVKPMSKYAEDVYPNNHTSVWGSWWSAFSWGYSCCHSTVKNSYCTGDAGKEAFEAEKRLKAGIVDGDAAEEEVEQLAIEAPSSKEKPTKPRDTEAETAKRKRTITEMTDGITEEEMENYRRKRTNAADPMAKMMSSEQLMD
ncbi:putative mRNA splicing protein [Microthyrium microscopicum]|uniref:Pre-mRNA-splicing factor SLU7 n=1 Tax=Microthyrium microscopicum TaxID=703497 RepID=A0A6A6UQT8_9PEZI|nr:putative mRNA splicing protein [Microthyrium microscopicum]